MKINKTIVIFTNGSTPTVEQQSLGLKLAMFNVIFSNTRYLTGGEFVNADAVAGDIPQEYEDKPNAEQYCMDYLEQHYKMSFSVGGKAPVKGETNADNVRNTEPVKLATEVPPKPIDTKVENQGENNRFGFENKQ